MTINEKLLEQRMRDYGKRFPRRPPWWFFWRLYLLPLLLLVGVAWLGSTVLPMHPQQLGLRPIMLLFATALAVESGLQTGVVVAAVGAGLLVSSYVLAGIDVTAEDLRWLVINLAMLALLIANAAMTRHWRRQHHRYTRE